jgi:E1A/CREB-binding protein
MPVTAENEERRLIIQQLMLLLHADKCLKAENTNCALPHCGTIKSVLQHMVQCTDGRECTSVF